jgi:hypothetical protein
MTVIRQFVTRIRKTRAFELVVVGFSITSSFIITLRVKAIRFTVSIHQLLNLASTIIYIKKMSFTVTLKQLLNLPTTLSIKKINLSIITSMLIKIINTLSVNIISISGTLKAILKLGTVTTEVNKILLTSSPLYAQFYLLSYYDDDWLSDIDDEWLSDLDYILL